LWQQNERSIAIVARLFRNLSRYVTSLVILKFSCTRGRESWRT